MADSPRLFTGHSLNDGSSVEATPGQAHYLGSVMRREAGSELRLFNGRDGEWLARVVSIRKDRAQFQLVSRTREQAPEPDLWLVFAPLKRDATDLVVQKATELGVSVLWPVFTARTNSGRVNLERMASTAMEAAEQSERLTVPEIRQPVGFFDMLAAWPAGRVLAAALERGEPAPVPRAGGLVVGPEGGFDPAEQEALRRAPFTAPIWLGPRILRAETAALAGLVLLQARGWSI